MSEQQQASKPNKYLSSRRKRALDYIGATALSAVTAPLEGLAAWYLGRVLDEGGPYFFQDRSVDGTTESTFEIKKLRTMNHEACHAKASDCLGDENRIPTRMARLIRALRIDELPQLEQVKEGRMSLVGPRPLIQTDHTKYSGVASKNVHARWQGLCVVNNPKAGATGPGQLVDSANYMQDREHVDRRLLADIEYMTSANLRTDLKLIFATPFILVCNSVQAALMTTQKLPGFKDSAA